MAVRLTIQEFIEKAIQIHGDKYDYSKVEYINDKTPVCIICPEHGEFWQKPCVHLTGGGCLKCFRQRISKKYICSTQEFIEKAKKVHGDKYDYSKVEYKGANEKVCIICPKHGEFWQTPSKHTNGKHGCPKCCKNGVRLTTQEFIEKAKKVHGDKYDYSKVEYVNSRTKICVICHKKQENGIEHGEFWITPNNLLRLHGCPKCEGGLPLTTEIFLENVKKVHGNRYNYSKVEYKNYRTKLSIICPEHGEFYQVASYHLQGNGCPKCNQSHLERDVMKMLENNNIKYEYQKRFGWLGKQSLDFYLPDYNIAIECQGEQHFKPVEIYGGEKSFERRIQLDKEKYISCMKNDTNIIYYTNIKNIPKNLILEDKYYFCLNKLINDIIK